MRALGDLVQDTFTSNVYATPVDNAQITQSGGLFDQTGSPSPNVPSWAWIAGAAVIGFLMFKKGRR